MRDRRVLLDLPTEAAPSERYEPYKIGIVKSLSKLLCKIDLDRFRGSADFTISQDTVYQIGLVQDVDLEKRIWLSSLDGRHAGRIMIPWSYEGLIFVRKIVEKTTITVARNRWFAVPRELEEMHTFAEGDVVRFESSLWYVTTASRDGRVWAENYHERARRIENGRPENRGYTGSLACQSCALMRYGPVPRSVPTKWGIFLGRMVSYGIPYETPFEDYLVLAESQELTPEGRDLTLLECGTTPSNIITIKSIDVDPLIASVPNDPALLRQSDVLRSIVEAYNSDEIPTRALQRLLANVT